MRPPAALTQLLSGDATHRMVMEVYLTDAGKKWIQEHHPQGIVWEYDPDKPFKLHSMAAEYVELTYLGIPYRIPHMADSKPTIDRTIAIRKLKLDYSKYETFKRYFHADGFFPFVGPIADLIKKRARKRLNLSEELDELIEAGVMSLSAISETELAMTFTLQDEYCEKCGNCCRLCNPLVVSKEELKEIADYLRLSYKKLKKGNKIFPRGRDYPGLFNIPAAPCPFLIRNSCSIYEVRPSVCRIFPMGWAMTRLFQGKGLMVPKKCAAIENILVELATARLSIELLYREKPELLDKIAEQSKLKYDNAFSKPLDERMQTLIDITARDIDELRKKSNKEQNS